MKMTADAILYYADNPVDFVEDVIRAKPDANQRDIQRGPVPHDVREKWTRYRQERGGELACDLVPDHPAVPENSLHSSYAAPAMGHPVGRDCEVVEKQPGPGE